MKRRLTPEELTAALALKLIVTARGCEVHDDPEDCEPPLQAAHVIPKQALRRRGLFEHVYDPRNGLCACYRAHRRSDAGLERFERIPDAAWEFATELGLDWMLERLYGEREVSSPVSAESLLDEDDFAILREEGERSGIVGDE